ncbi:MAG TPA: hypothetical protein DCP64_02895 [Sarcina sp.]|nr:hypothetical protein [Sarcina sp.]
MIDKDINEYLKEQQAEAGKLTFPVYHELGMKDTFAGKLVRRILREETIRAGSVVYCLCMLFLKGG